MPALGVLLGLVLVVGTVTGCTTGPPQTATEAETTAGSAPVDRPADDLLDPTDGFRPSAAEEAFLDELQERTFRWFWDLAHPETGLVPDRWPTESFASIAATGFGLTAYPIGVERGWVSREDAAERTVRTLRFLWQAPQGPEPAGVIGHRGLYYHFLDPATGHRFETVELSTIDTALLVGGVLFARGYFDRDAPEEAEIRELATRIADRVDWTWARPNPPAVNHGWKPEVGFLEHDWRGYNEAMILYLLALGSTTHPVEPEAWDAWTEPYQWREFQGREQVVFGPLFGHQYSHLWVDFRGIRDDVMERHGIDYFENSRRATLSQRDWAIENPRGWLGLGPDIWGVTACDGPLDVELRVSGVKRRFWTYAGRGVTDGFQIDDGTIAPTAAGGSAPFAPEVAIPALMAMRDRYGEHLWGEYGFLDAFNPTFDFDLEPQHGRVVPGEGWFDTDYLGIDQGPILIMIENLRSGLVWEVMRRDPDLGRGLERAGFRGGWLEDGGRSE